MNQHNTKHCDQDLLNKLKILEKELDARKNNKHWAGFYEKRVTCESSYFQPVSALDDASVIINNTLNEIKRLCQKLEFIENKVNVIHKDKNKLQQTLHNLVSEASETFGETCWCPVASPAEERLEPIPYCEMCQARETLTETSNPSDDEEDEPVGNWVREQQLRHRLAKLRRAPHPYGDWAADILWRTDPEAEGPNPGYSPDEAPSPWRPIETAPTDGTTVDLWANGERWTDMVWRRSSPANPKGAWARKGDDWPDEMGWLDPTHWMKQPPDPNSNRWQ